MPPTLPSCCKLSATVCSKNRGLHCDPNGSLKNVWISKLRTQLGRTRTPFADVLGAKPKRKLSLLRRRSWTRLTTSLVSLLEKKFKILETLQCSGDAKEHLKAHKGAWQGPQSDQYLQYHALDNFTKAGLHLERWDGM
jgi:hypothetical protein